MGSRGALADLTNSPSRSFAKKRAVEDLSDAKPQKTKDKVSKVYGNLGNDIKKTLQFLEVPREITSALFIGSSLVAKNKSLLISSGFTHILILEAGTRPFNDNFKCMIMPLDDDDFEVILNQLFECYQFIRSAVESKGKILVHCTDGVSRSAAVIIYYLMKSLKWNYDTASKYVAQKREVAVPNPGYELQLRFLDSSFYKHCTESTITEQYAYWKEHSEDGEINCIKAREKELLLQLEEERKLHDRTRGTLEEVTQHAEEGKQTLRELVEHVTVYMHTEKGKDHKVTIEEYQQLTEELEEENAQLRQDVDHLKKQILAQKREAVENLSTLMHEITRIEESNEHLEAEVEKEKQFYQKEIRNRDKVIEENKILINSLFKQLREK